MRANVMVSKINYFMTKEIVLLDLFSGIGGFAKGFLDAGLNITHSYFSEIDKDAIAVYRYHFKNAKYAGDIRTLSGKNLTPKPNLITFGFPCQDLSPAGKRAGLLGARSGLFYEAIRLIKEIRPEVFVFENVKGLLSNNKGKDFEVVLQTIANLGLYECEWQLVNTRWVLPQNRERVYFVGHLRGASQPRIFPFRESDFRVNERKNKAPVARTITGGGHSGGHHSRMTLVKEVNPEISYCISAGYGKGRYGKGRGTIIKPETKNDLRRLTEIECERLQGFPDDWTKFGDYNRVIKKVSRTQRYKQLGNAVTTVIPRMIAERLISKTQK